MPALLLWLMRWLGRLLLAAGCGVVLAVIAIQLARVGLDAAALTLTPRDWLVFRNALILAAAAVVGAHILALTVILILARLPRGLSRSAISALALVPLICMPSIHAYAVALLTSCAAAQSLLAALPRAFADAMPLAQSALVLSLWLWPIPALVLSSAFRHTGRSAYTMALLDTSPRVALRRAAWPAMRPAVLATAAAVAILAVNDSTVAPLMLAPDVWSVEMMVRAAVVGSKQFPAAVLVLSAWPMLAVLCILALLAAPGLRQMLSWGDEPELDANPSRPGRAATLVAAAYAAFLALAPLAVFAFFLSDDRLGPREAFEQAFRELRHAAPGALAAAAGAGLGAVAIAAAALTPRRASGRPRIGAAIVTLISLACAVLPPALSATALIECYSSALVSPRDLWNIYDNSPLPWIAGLLVRFAFIPVCLAVLMSRRAPLALADQARCETSGTSRLLAAAAWPFLRRPALAAGLLVACLSLSEVQLSTLLQPPQWGGGSLAVIVDSHMHYQRHGRTVAMAILMMAPALLFSVVVPMGWHALTRITAARR